MEDQNGSSDGLEQLVLNHGQWPPLTWLTQIRDRCFRDGRPCSAHPYVVGPLVALLDDHLSSEALAAKRIVNMASSQLDALATIANDYQWIDPVESQVRIRVSAALREELRRLETVFARVPAESPVARRIAKVAAFGGLQLYDALEIQKLLSSRSLSKVLLGAHLAATAKAVDVEWSKWARDCVRRAIEKDSLSRPEAVAATVAWCLLMGSKDELGPGPASAIAMNALAGSLACLDVLRLFDGKRATKARRIFVQYAPFPHFALSLAGALLSETFDQDVRVMSQEGMTSEIKYVYNRPPKRILELKTLSNDEAAVLEAIAMSPVAFETRTNFWRSWGLPDSVQGLLELIAQRTSRS